MHAEAHVRAVGEANLEADVVTPHVEPVGLGEHGRVAVRTRERDGDDVALTERHAGKLRVARHVPVDDGRGGLEAERLLDRCREQGRLGLDERLLRRVGEQVHERVRDHRLRRLDAAKQEHPGVRSHLRPGQPARGGSGRDERRRRLAVERGLDRQAQVGERLLATPVRARLPR